MNKAMNNPPKPVIYNGIEYKIHGTGYYVSRKPTFKLLHRVIMEEYYGLTLTRKTIVHHKDGNPLNNDISNLELMNLAEHSRLHRLHDKKHIKICLGCGKAYETAKLNRGKWCSVNCGQRTKRASAYIIVVSCTYCGQEYERNKFTKGKACSTSCANRTKARVKEKTNNAKQ